MKIILRVLFALLIALILLIIVGLFLPKSLRIVTIREVSSSPSVVYEQLNQFKNWSNWSPWQEKDSAMQIQIGEPSKGKGAIMNWKSAVFGNCKATITHSVQPESMAVDFNFGTSNKTVSLWYIEPTDLGSRINWTFNLTRLNLFERYFALFEKKEMKSFIEDGIDNLKSACESAEKSRIGEISVINPQAQPSVIMVDTVTLNQSIERRPKMISYVANFLSKRGLTATGKAFGLYMGSTNDSTLIYACGFPIKERTWVWKTLSYYEIPATRAVSVSHYGGTNATKAVKAINKYVKENNLQTGANVIEEYLYNPDTDKDTSNWEIKVMVPLK
jgi:effector-binding domain-containing protein